MIPLATELERLGCETSADGFRDMIQELKAVMYPCWTDEELMQHPDEAKRYCVVVRRQCKCKNLPDNLILRTLSNVRKARNRTA